METFLEVLSWIGKQLSQIDYAFKLLFGGTAVFLLTIWVITGIYNGLGCDMTASSVHWACGPTFLTGVIFAIIGIVMVIFGISELDN